MGGREDIVPDPDQPRKTFSPEALRSLGHTIAETGQINPIAVRPRPEGKYTLVVGEGHWRAAKEAGLFHVEAMVRQDVNDRKAREIQLVENYQHKDVPPLEQSRSFKDYLDRLRSVPE